MNTRRKEGDGSRWEGMREELGGVEERGYIQDIVYEKRNLSSIKGKIKRAGYKLFPNAPEHLIYYLALPSRD